MSTTNQEQTGGAAGYAAWLKRQGLPEFAPEKLLASPDSLTSSQRTYLQQYIYQAGYHAALSFIQSPTDGPVTRFVMIARAMEYARRAGPSPNGDDPIANALVDALDEGERLDTVS